MKTNSFVNGLALAGALFVLVGVFFAASDALADVAVAADETNTATQSIIDESLANAESANQAAVKDAVAAAIVNNQLDLDIRLLDRSSSLIVRNL